MLKARSELAGLFRFDPPLEVTLSYGYRWPLDRSKAAMLTLDIASRRGCGRFLTIGRCRRAEASKHANCPGRTNHGHRCRCARAAIQRAHHDRHGQLPWLQVPVEALRSQELDRHPRNPSARGWRTPADARRASNLGPASLAQSANFFKSAWSLKLPGMFGASRFRPTTGSRCLAKSLRPLWLPRLPPLN